MATPFEQLEAMRSVAANWDGYDADPPQADAIDEAAAFLLRMARSHPEMANPYVTPTRDGGALFAWDFGPHSLEVHFDPAAVGIEVSFVYLNTETKDTASGVLRDAATTTIAFPLRQLVIGMTAGGA